MNEVRRLLAPGGVVHIAIPNIACWEAALAGWTSYEMITLNEGHNMEAVLENLKGWAQEVFLVDSYSQDEWNITTARICTTGSTNRIATPAPKH